MIGNIAPDDIRKWKVSFENIPLALEATGAFVNGMKEIELTSKPSDRPWPVDMTHTCEVTDNSHSPVTAFFRRWSEAAKPEPAEAPYSVYAVPGGAVVEYKWPCFQLKFRSLRLARMFAKNYKIEWQIETKEAPANE